MYGLTGEFRFWEDSAFLLPFLDGACEGCPAMQRLWGKPGADESLAGTLMRYALTEAPNPPEDIWLVMEAGAARRFTGLGKETERSLLLIFAQDSGTGGEER